MSDQDAVWKALADATRRALLDDLADGPRTTGDLVERHDHLCRTAVMKHLDLLEAAGLVVVRRRGRYRYNHINPLPIHRVCERWVDRHTRRLSAALTRLQKIAEGSRESPA